LEQVTGWVRDVTFAMAAIKKKVCLIVIDGWGISENKEGNLIFSPTKQCLFIVGVHCSTSGQLV